MPIRIRLPKTVAARLRGYAPSLADIFFAALLVAAFARPGGFDGLLADGDTGWHIRTGELILVSGRIPATDPYSFSRPGEPWFAWEWLSDTIFAVAFRGCGLWGVAALAGCMLSLAATLLFVWSLRRGAGLWVSAAVTFAAVSASSLHYLARPHVFSILFYTVAVSVLDEDRRRPSAKLWLLVPLCALWVNLHGGFVAAIATTALLSATSAFHRNVRAFRRYAMLTLFCLGATLANPFGWRLHQHIWTYLRSPWILNYVQEFRSPDIRNEGMLVFAALLLLGAALSARSFALGRWFEGTLVLAWGFAGMRSARHIPFFVIAAAPVIAEACASWWSNFSSSLAPRAGARVLWELGEELAGARRVTVWLPIMGAAALAIAPTDRVHDFPQSRFPVQAVERNSEAITAGQPRILTSDQWSDYLIFRLYPRQRVFFDGRSDFYGPQLGEEYRTLMTAGKNWPTVLARHRFSAALLPHEWPLSTFLDREPGWRRVYGDDVAVLFVKERRP